MTSLFHAILAEILSYKYPTLFVVAFLSSLGIPLPAGSSTMAAAALASEGYSSITLVCIMGALGNILGDVTMYALSRKFGLTILRWLRLQKLAESRAIKNAEDAEIKYSAVAIVSSRFQDQATTIVNILAGLGRMDFKKFLMYAVIGDIAQTIFYGSIGYFFAESWQDLYNTVGTLSWLIVLATLVVTVIIARKVKNKMTE